MRSRTTAALAGIGGLFALCVVAGLLPGATIAYRIGLVLAAFVALFLLSPDRLLRGVGAWPADALYTLFCGLALAPAIVALLKAPFGLVANAWLLPIGVVGLLGTAVWRSRTATVIRGGVLWALRQREGPTVWRDVVCAVLVLLFPVVLLRPLLLFAAPIAPHPWIGAFVFAALGLIVWSLRNLHPHLPLLLSVEGVLLSIAAALLLRFLAEGLPQIAIGVFDVISNSFAGGVSFSVLSILSLGGLVLLVVLPLEIWYSLVLLRSTGDHAHLPSWRPWRIALVYGLLTAVFLAPLATPAWTVNGGVDFGIDALVVEAPSALYVALIFSIGVGVIAGLLSILSTGVRRVAPALPFLICALGVVGYALLAFISEFVSAGSISTFAIQQGWYASAIAGALLSASAGLALILGVCGFAYEIARD